MTNLAEFFVYLFFLAPTFSAFFITFSYMMKERNNELFKDISKNDKY